MEAAVIVIDQSDIGVITSESDKKADFENYLKCFGTIWIIWDYLEFEPIRTHLKQLGQNLNLSLSICTDQEPFRQIETHFELLFGPN